MPASPHPYMNSTYEIQRDGRVLVRDNDAGTSGIFDELGRWCEGELRFADIQFVRWVAETEEFEGDE